MTKFYAFCTTLLLSLVICSSIYAQGIGNEAVIAKKDSTKGSSSGKPSFKIGVNYSNNNVYLGRSDTVKTSIVSPNAKYTFSNGIFISGNLSIIPNETKKLNGGEFSAGYDHDFTDNLSGGLSYAKLFYNANSTQVGAGISDVFDANLSYDFGDILSATFNGDYNINRKGTDNDVLLNFGLSHDFAARGIFGDKDLFIFSPTASFNAGTQNFYNDFLVRRKLRNAKLVAAQTKLLAQYQAQLSQFNILDYEISAPLEYKNNAFIFTLTPTYSIAKNKLAQGVIPGQSSDNNLFYFEVGVALKF